jgi:hypothetical protein
MGLRQSEGQITRDPVAAGRQRYRLASRGSKRNTVTGAFGHRDGDVSILDLTAGAGSLQSDVHGPPKLFERPGATVQPLDFGSLFRRIRETTCHADEPSGLRNFPIPHRMAGLDETAEDIVR